MLVLMALMALLFIRIRILHTTLLSFVATCESRFALLPVSSAGPSAVVVGGKATLRTHSRDLVSWKKRNNVAPSRRLGHFASIHLSKSFVMRRYEIFTVCVVVGTCKNTIFRYI